MTTLAEARESLTGPGGAFEVTTEVVDGHELRVYKDRLPNLRSVGEIAAMRDDEQPFIVYGDLRIGFTEFFGLANSVSAALRDRFGIEHGDRVAVLSANNPEWCISFWGTVDIGAILVGLNGWWKTDEIIYGLQDSGSRVLVADRGRFERIAPYIGTDELPDLEAVFLADVDPADVADAVPEAGRALLHRFDELTGDLDAPMADTPIDEADYAVIFYTSGTTGRPKGAISSHRSMIANLQGTMYSSIAGSMVNEGAGSINPSGQNASLLTSPLFHVAGCHSGLVVGLIAGIKIVMTVGRFEPKEAMRLIQEEKVTVWAAVPTMVWRVVEDPDRH